MAPKTNLDEGAIVLRQARWKLVLAVAGSLGFCAIGLWIVRDAKIDNPSDPWPHTIVGCIVILVFASSAVLGAFGVVRPASLTIDQRGLTLRAFFKDYVRPWSDISGFRIRQIRSTKIIVYNDAAPPYPKLSALNRYLVGSNSSLPGALGKRPEELLALVEAAKARWG